MSRPTGKLFGWILALAAIALFCSLGIWQLDRAEKKEAMLAASQRVLAGRDGIMGLSAAADHSRRQDFDWAAGEGSFVPGPAILLDNQMRAGRAGVRVYRAFQPGDGGVPLLVELGWLPVPADRRMPAVAIPEGSQHLAGLLAPPPAAGFVTALPAALPNGDLLTAALDIGQLPQTVELRSLAPRVLKLDPALPLGYPRDLDILPNTLPPQRHLGYAVQWFGLALAVLVTALVLTLRRRRRR